MKRVIAVPALLSAVACAAQLLTANGAAITVHSGAQLTVKGDVQSTAGATIANNGTIDLSGDWTNDAGNDCFGDSEGTVVLNGAGQQIGGGSVTQFNQLELLGGDATLMVDASTGGSFATTRSGTLELNGAKLLLNSHLLTVTNPEPGAITRTTGFIVSETDPMPGYGRLTWHIGDHGPAAYTVPFGNAASGHYLPLVLNLTVAGSDPGGTFTFATYPTDPFATPNNRPLPSGLLALTDIAGVENAPSVLDRFWSIAANDYAAAPTATLTFSYRDSEWSTGTNTIAEGALQAQCFNGTVWSLPPTGIANTGANTVLTSPTNAFNSIWALTMSSSPLPVELLAFTAHRLSDRVVQLDWSTATERDNAGFEVWRMIEGEDGFTEVGWVDGAGNTQQLTAYTHRDDNAASATSYYKLKQVDGDGRYDWSPVAAVAGAGSTTQLVAYPNPAKDAILLSGLAQSTTGIALLDPSGRLVKQWGSATMLEGLGGFERGVYLLVVTDSGGGTDSIRVVLE